MINPVELIIKKRNGNELTKDELRDFVSAYLAKKIPDFQMSAMLMAIFYKGMTPDEIVAFTDVFIKSGKTIDFSGMNTVDKHSTGGVGDKITLMLAPICAALGLKVPMISGRGLGHTGGTLDKIESIPGMRTNFTDADLLRFVELNGFGIISQTAELVPADKQIYDLRNVTGTVESLPLISASIMSKKIAEGAKNLVMDVKVGTGAFMQTLPDAEALASQLKRTGEGFGQKVSVVFTSMNAPLGEMVGNSLEIIETIEYLKGANLPDIDIITRALAVEMLLLTGQCTNAEIANREISRVIADGSALARFREWVRLQGGNPAVVDDYSLLPVAKVEVPVLAQADGWLSQVNSREIGYALVSIGANRRLPTDTIDYGVGARLTKKIGDKLTKGEQIGTIYAHSVADGKMVAERVEACYTVTSNPVSPDPVVIQVWSGV